MDMIGEVLAVCAKQASSPEEISERCGIASPAAIKMACDEALAADLVIFRPEDGRYMVNGRGKARLAKAKAESGKPAAHKVAPVSPKRSDETPIDRPIHKPAPRPAPKPAPKAAAKPEKKARRFGKKPPKKD